MVEDEHVDLVDGRRQASAFGRTAPNRGGKGKTVGVLESKVNATYIGERCHRESQTGCKGMRMLAPAHFGVDGHTL